MTSHELLRRVESCALSKQGNVCLKCGRPIRGVYKLTANLNAICLTCAGQRVAEKRDGGESALGISYVNIQ